MVLFGLAIFLVIPLSVGVSNMIEETYADSIEQTLELAKDTTVETELSAGQEEGGEEGNLITNIWGKITDGISSFTTGVAEKFSDMVNRFMEALAIMLVTSCFIPIGVLFFMLWLVKVLIGIDVPVNYRKVFSSMRNRLLQKKKKKNEELTL